MATAANPLAWTPRAETFTWTVHPGTNRLQVKTRNQFGVEGPITTAELVLEK